MTILLQGGLPGSRTRYVPKTRIGHSLTLCLADISSGKVRIEEVAYILAQVRYRDLAHMLECVAEWRVGRVDRHLEIARTLWESGRIFLPAMTMDGRSAPVWQTIEPTNWTTGHVVSLTTSASHPIPLADISLTAPQATAFKVMVEGRTALIVGVSQSGRSTLAALSAIEWDRTHDARMGKALVVCRDGRKAMAMRNHGVENVITYAEIDEFDTAEVLATLGKYRLFIFDDYDPAWAQVADMCVSNGLISPSRTLPVVRIADSGSMLDQSADIALTERMRAA